nr:LpqC [uncultured bacterium]
MPLLHQFYVYDAWQLYYHLYLPVNYRREQATPLLFVLHGGASDGNGMIKLTDGGFNRLADEYNFMVCYPDGIGRYNRQNSPRALAHADAEVFRGLLSSLASYYTIDQRRVFVTGLSDGGNMAYRLACDLPDEIAGIAAVAALMPTQLTPTRPMPVLFIAGTEDPMVPYKGGAVGGRLLQRGTVRSAMETLRVWSEANRCGGEPTTELLDDVDPHDRMSVQQTFYRDCVASVMMYTIIGGGHTWPGGKQYLDEKIIGRTSRDIDANRVIWDFFRGLHHE